LAVFHGKEESILWTAQRNAARSPTDPWSAHTFTTDRDSELVGPDYGSKRTGEHTKKGSCGRRVLFPPSVAVLYAGEPGPPSEGEIKPFPNGIEATLTKDLAVVN
jgi:hypothetical protein